MTIRISSLVLLFSGLSLLAQECLTWVVTRQLVARLKRSKTMRSTWSQQPSRACQYVTLQQQQQSTDTADIPELSTNSTGFTSDEIAVIESIRKNAEASTVEQALLSALSTMSPGLIMKLRCVQERSHHQSPPVASVDESIQIISKELDHLLQGRLEQAKFTLQELLQAGELRKLDGLIGKANKQGRLDAAFFNVLTMNLRAAANDDENTIPGKKQNELPRTEAATRLQILQHIMTRCEEEVEKQIPPAMALFNKLLRTQQLTIRRNLYQHYLTTTTTTTTAPKSNVITAPDGTQVKLPNRSTALISLSDFIQAIATGVEQIRTVEHTGGMDRESAAHLVELCRHVAKEARLVIAEQYGTSSKELECFEEGLQPVFRPTSTDSPYIKGQA